MTRTTTYRQIGIMGTGRVASALGLALAGHSRAPVLVWGRNSARAQALAGGIGHAQAAVDGETMVQGSELIVLAVADDALEAVVARVAKEDLSHRPFIVHVSGKDGVAILALLEAKGARVAAIHPAMTFTGSPRAEVGRMAGAAFAMTARDAESWTQARRMVGLLGGIPVEVREDRRMLYHAALCHAANHLVTLLAGSREALVAAGVAAPEVVLGPLVRAAMENALVQGIDALSGPLLRGDRGTVARHLAALATDCAPVLPAYRAMAAATLAELGRQRHDVSPQLYALLATDAGWERGGPRR